MAGFQTHITVSTITGIAYGVWGFQCGAPVETCVLAGGLCSVSGMLPDLDSDSGRPVHEMSAFAAAIVPMLMLERFENFGWSRESMVLAGAAIYAAIRFGVAELFKRYTVHRGMWHSIPACLACGLLAFLVVAGQDIAIRAFKAGAVSLGFLSHLLLDELWSLRLRSGKLNVKRSFGTALKFFGTDKWANLSVYGTLAVIALLAVGDPMLMNRFGYEVKFGPHTAQQVLDKALELAGVQKQPAAGEATTIQR
ncbi:MAG TPA: metal-dependent hydrolase [Pirellulaceae bacterium]|nr:metal-dependent hydrolase [Pirellulaceae bacterium]